MIIRHSDCNLFLLPLLPFFDNIPTASLPTYPSLPPAPSPLPAGVEQYSSTLQEQDSSTCRLKAFDSVIDNRLIQINIAASAAFFATEDASC
jgi:hypothetical protein